MFTRNALAGPARSRSLGATVKRHWQLCAERDPDRGLIGQTKMARLMPLRERGDVEAATSGTIAALDQTLRAIERDDGERSDIRARSAELAG